MKLFLYTLLNFSCLIRLWLQAIMKNYSLQAGGGEGGFKTVVNVPVYELGSEIRAALSSLYIQQLKCQSSVNYIIAKMDHNIAIQQMRMLILKGARL